jgi:type VI secretion system protein ImpA
VRGGPFHWIDEEMRGLRFPTTLRLTPLVFGTGQDKRPYSLFDCRPPPDQKLTEAVKALKAEAERAIEAADNDKLTAQLQEVTGSLEQASGLAQALAARMAAADAPALTNTRAALTECKTFLEQILQKRPGGETKADTVAGERAPAAAGLGSGASRVEIYRQLEQAALALQEVEPHSPIPYLLLRAVELGRMPFPQLMKELVRDSGALTELKREFGIKDPPTPSE